MKLGGPNVYHGKLVEKPFIGTEFSRPGKGAIIRACELMLVACLLAVVVFWGGQWLAVLLAEGML